MKLMNDFKKYQAATSPYPLAMEVSHAKGSYIYDNHQKAYLDFVAGVSACTLGHCHPNVTKAIKEQTDRYLHVMVYGEYIQDPAVQFCKLLAQQLPENLSRTYLVNSGTEAIEGALKLAKRATGRHKIVSCHNAYHGNTMGSMSVMGVPERKNAFRPLIPGTTFITFNNESDLTQIDHSTAAVIMESIQGGAGFILPENNFLKKVKTRCEEVGALLILDEIQPGFGRTGKLFGFQHYDMQPDILVMGKGMGGGMPVGAFTSSPELMDLLIEKPKLGHITTFGGHPVIAAASLATLQELTQTSLIEDTLQKEKLFRSLLIHPYIKEIRGKGLMLALLFDTPEMANKVLFKCLEKGLILFWLLFEQRALRITPPLTLSYDEIELGCQIILESINEIVD